METWEKEKVKAMVTNPKIPKLAAQFQVTDI
jgi:hypothetical protein